MSQHLTQGLAWKTSSWSVGDGACVEVARSELFVYVRDSKRRDGPMLSVRLDAWIEFINTVKAGLRFG